MRRRWAALLLVPALAAWPRPAHGDPPEPVAGSVACEVVWEDSRALPEAERAYGPGVREELRVEVCALRWARYHRLLFWKRLVRQAATPTTVETDVVVPWSMESQRVVQDRTQDEAQADPPGPVQGDDDGGHP